MKNGRADGQAVTLQHVGDRLGLSRTTISLALRNHPRISAATKKKVFAAAEQLGYQPDQVARALATGRSSLIGVVVPNTTDHYYAEVFRGIEDAAQETGYHLLLSSGTHDPKQGEARIRDLVRLKVAGVIAAPPFTAENGPIPRFWKQLSNEGFPVVLINRELNPPLFHQVSIDNKGGIRMAVETLARLGHKRVAYISGTPAVIPIQQRLQAFQECAAQYGLDADVGLIDESPHNVRGGYESCARLWSRLRKKPTAILVFSDAPSLGVLRFLHENKIGVPEKVSVLGFDGTDSSEFSLISLSTVATPMYEMGMQAFRLLEKTMNQHYTRPQSVLLPVRLEMRESVGQCP